MQSDGEPTSTSHLTQSHSAQLCLFTQTHIHYSIHWADSIHLIRIHAPAKYCSGGERCSIFSLRCCIQTQTVVFFLPLFVPFCYFSFIFFVQIRFPSVFLPFFRFLCCDHDKTFSFSLDPQPKLSSPNAALFSSILFFWRSHYEHLAATFVFLAFKFNIYQFQLCVCVLFILLSYFPPHRKCKISL